ncbi:polysaccharide deacetylase family protein [Halobium salinum]|uniref:Polysaccharide deacetylase family protein n=1 Tax=Halobium salinum TaxID=1364940 RepID=A0ABD5PCL9_9EURY|nr:polysaccharide deacetylase family protein [Halobium salinum]
MTGALNRRTYLRAAGGAVALASGAGVVSGTGTNGKLVFVYDDGPDDDYTRALPIHEEEGVPACSACMGASVVPGREHYMGPDQLVELEEAGWEIMSHSLYHLHHGEIDVTRSVAAEDERLSVAWDTHANPPKINSPLVVSDGGRSATVTVVGSGTDDTGEPYLQLDGSVGTTFDAGAGVTERFSEDIMRDRLARSVERLEGMGVTVDNFVYPYGAHSAASDRVTRELFDAVANWGKEGGRNPGQGADPYRLRRQQFDGREASFEEIARYLDRVAENDELGILGGHTFYDDLPASRIRKTIRMAKKRGLEIVTLREALEADGTASGGSSGATSTPTPTPTATPTQTSTATPDEVEDEEEDASSGTTRQSSGGSGSSSGGSGSSSGGSGSSSGGSGSNTGSSKSSSGGSKRSVGSGSGERSRTTATSTPTRTTTSAEGPASRSTSTPTATATETPTSSPTTEATATRTPTRTHTRAPAERARRTTQQSRAKRRREGDDLFEFVDDIGAFFARLLGL